MVDFNTFMDELNRITGVGQFSEAPKLNPSKPTVVNSPGVSLGKASTGGGSDLDKLIRAIRQNESSDNYGAINRDSGALGGYQIMPFNLSFGGGDWDQRALGRRVSRNEFMSNPGLQDAIARWQLGNYLSKYGAAGAAAAWYGGPGAVKNMHSKKTQTGGYPSIYEYWNSVLSKM